MIKLRDASMLALTKLRTRKVRLIITVVISGLLFGGLAGASMVARGVMSSIDSFSKEGLGERFIAQGYMQKDYDFMNKEIVLERAEAIHKEIVERKKVEAKRLGITYDPISDPSPIQEYDVPGGKQRSLNTDHPAGRQAAQEYQEAHFTAPLAEMKRVTTPYQPTAIYESAQVPYMLGGATLQVLKDGKESFGSEGGKMESGGSPNSINSFVTSWSSMSSALLDPFMLEGQDLQVDKDGSIPIVVPNSAAEQLLKLSPLPQSASSDDKLARIKEIRAKAPSITFEVCYRNASSATLVNNAITTAQEIERNKNKKDYQKPSLIYGVPSEPCGEVPIVHDKRTKNEKALADKQRQFDELFGAKPPEQSAIKFHVVGISPDFDFSAPAFGVGQIIRSLVSSSLGAVWYMPAEQVANNPTVEKIFNSKETNPLGTFTAQYAEFSTAAQARSFIEQENCEIDYSKLSGSVSPQALCQEQGNPFSLTAYGSNSLALESARRDFGKFFGLAALAVSIVAAIIMMGTVGRTIADSRRETAVFRAIGAKRFDITQIYLVYTVCLSLLIALFASLAGLILALFIHRRMADEVTVQALVAYSAKDLDKTFDLYGLYLPDLLLLVGLAVAAGLVSSIIPLIRNSRRNPIRDMRDDT